MAFVEWSEDVSVHVKEIDMQHKNFLKLINKAHDIDWSKNIKRGSKILNKLIEFTRVHFTTEENYFTKCNYEGARAHILEHSRYILKVLDIQRDYEAGKISREEILKFLKTWWEDHLIKMDQKYVENFKSCGLS